MNKEKQQEIENLRYEILRISYNLSDDIPQAYTYFYTGQINKIQNKIYDVLMSMFLDKLLNK
jgi:hypothetical protein